MASATPSFGMIIIVVLVVGLIGLAVVAALVGAFSIRRPRLGHATLKCPHCGAETRADRQKCTACQADL